MNIESPKDAEGREIPLDTKVLYAWDGSIRKVIKWICDPNKYVGWVVRVKTNEFEMNARPEFLYLTPPDSWEKLEEDLDRGIKEDCLCPYNPSEECSRCVLPIETENHCNSIALKEIKERIRKLRGESDA